MVSWHLTIDCTDPARLVEFWGPALGYVVPPPPDGQPTWNDWYLSVGVPPEELDLAGDGSDRLVDPAGAGPRIWFQVVSEAKTVKKRRHLDLYPGGGRQVPLAERIPRVEAKVTELVAAGASIQHRHAADADHYAVALHDPEGNEFCVA